MLKKFLVSLVASLVMMSNSHAADKSHALGFAAGSTYGIGLSPIPNVALLYRWK
jgi:hypothetical protein